MSIRWI